MNKKMRNIRRAWIIMFPAVIIFGIMTVWFAVYGLYPFGESTVSWCDMNQQVVPLLLDFKDILCGRSGFFLSFANGAGMNFFGVFFFFLASPFSFLVLFIEKSQLMGFMNVLTVLKLMCCGITANIYFQKSCRNRQLSPWIGILLSLLYVFGGYGFLYYQNSIWLDEMYLFPLLLLSFEELLEKGKMWPYVAAITAVVTVNYYISYMVILFTLLYFGLHFWQERGKNQEAAARRFIGGSLLGALLSAVVWLPSFYQYLTSGRQSDILAGLSDCSFLGRWNTTLLVILASGAVFSVLMVSRVLGDRREREYQKERILFVLLCIPIILEPVNRMWHTGSYMAFPTRYGFMTIFMGLCCALRVLPGEREKRSGAVQTFFTAIGGVLTAGYILFLIWYWKEAGKDLTAYTSTLWGSNQSAAGLILAFAAAFAVYGSLYLLYRIGARRGMAVFLSLLVVLAEASFNIHVYMISAENDTSGYKAIMNLEDKIKDSGFWRIKTKRHLMDDNMEGAMGYRALSHYTSLTSEEYMFMMKHLGYSSYWMKVSSYGGTKFSDALLSVKYAVDGTGNLQECRYANERYGITQLQYSLPLGLLYEGDLSGVENVTERIPFQERIFEELWEEEPLFEQYPITAAEGCTCTREEGKYRFRVSEEGEAYLNWLIPVEGKQTLYLDCFDSYSNRLTEKVNGSFDVFVNGRNVCTGYPRQSQNGILELGTFENVTVSVRLKVKKGSSCASFGLYGMKEEVLERAVSRAVAVDFKEQSNGVEGRIHLEKEQECLLTIPYDTGFTVRINGQKAEYRKVLGGFISFTIPAGNNKISVTYVSPGFGMGLVLTGSGMMIVFLGMILKKRKTAGTAEAGGSPIAVFLCRLAAVGVVIVIYIFPLIWNMIG